MTIKQVAFTAVITAFTPAIFWLGGFDFDARGADAVLCAIATAITAGWAWMGYHIFYD